MLEVYCDGGSRGNPGPAGFGYVVKKEGRVIQEGKGFIGVATNNFAEYTALIEALRWLGNHFRGEELKIFLDSELVVSQVSGVYKVKSSQIRDLLFKVRELEAAFSQIAYKHIPRGENKEADKLVNLALDERERWN